MIRRLLVEGWRFLPHSYALVAQSHCQCLLQRDDIELRFLDLPYYYDTWRRTRGVFSPEQEQALAALRPPEAGFVPQATFSLRPERPDFGAPASGRKFVFSTPEYRILRTENRSGLRSAKEVPETVSVITPSHWTALAYERFGMSPERIHVVPHGIEPAVFRPDSSARGAARKRLGVDGAFVFLSIGAMTWNKGLDLLMAAFARVAEADPDVRLLLKGADALYSSREYVREVLDELPAPTRELVVSKLIYTGDTYSSAMLADLIRAADVYVAPYRAEGFNMPVLEAAACGTPVICTGGGPTDEFTEESFARRIRSRLARIQLSSDDIGDCLDPDPDHLVELMLEALRERDAAPRRGAAGAAHVSQHLSWERVTEQLVGVLFAGVSG
jgi:glycosyltransferase involved in cell wall biosynthesis